MTDNADKLSNVAKVVKSPPKIKAKVNGKVRETTDPRYKDRADVITFKKDGREVSIRFLEGHERIAMALKELNAGETNSFVRGLALPSTRPCRRSSP